MFPVNKENKYDLDSYLQRGLKSFCRKSLGKSHEIKTDKRESICKAGKISDINRNVQEDKYWEISGWKN